MRCPANHRCSEGRCCITLPAHVKATANENLAAAGWLQRQRMNRTVEGGAGIETGVQGTVRIEPGDIITQGALTWVKSPPINTLPSGCTATARTGCPHRVRAREEGGVEGAVGIQPGDVVAIRAGVRREVAANDELAGGQGNGTDGIIGAVVGVETFVVQAVRINQRNAIEDGKCGCYRRKSCRQ